MQQRSEKTAEPSMEAILASIRKIIAEDPVPAPSAAAPAAAPNPLLKPLAPSPLAAARPIEPPKEPARAAMPVAVPTAPSMPQGRLSDMMRELAPSAVPVGPAPSVPPAPSFHDDLADLVEGDEPAPAPQPPLSARPDPAPRFEPLAATKIETPPAPMPALAPASAATPRHADLGAFIPSTAEPIGMTAPRPKPLSIGADLRRDAVAEPPVPPVLDLGSPLNARRDSAEPPLAVSRPVLPEFAPPAEPELRAAQPEPVETGLFDDAEPVVPAPAATSDTESMAAAQSALGALALGLAAQHASPETAVVPASHMEAAVGETPAAADVGRRTLDDTIVDMLRPMIRCWLDDHLPEMVDKALRQELEDRSRSGR